MLSGCAFWFEKRSQDNAYEKLENKINKQTQAVCFSMKTEVTNLEILCCTREVLGQIVDGSVQSSVDTTREASLNWSTFE